MAAVKDRHELSSYFEKGYKEKYNTTPNLNRFAAQWVWEAMLGTMSKPQVKEVIDFFFTTNSSNRHEFQWFSYNYDKIITSMLETKDDSARRLSLMEQSKLRAEQWRQSGKQGIAND